MIEMIVQRLKSISESFYKEEPGKRKLCEVDPDEDFSDCEPSYKRIRREITCRRPPIRRTGYYSEGLFSKMKSWLFEKPPSAIKVTKLNKNVDALFNKSSLAINQRITNKENQCHHTDDEDDIQLITPKAKTPAIYKTKVNIESPRIDPSFQFQPTLTSTASKKPVSKSSSGGAKCERSLLGMYRKRPPSAFIRSFQGSKPRRLGPSSTVIKDCYRMDDRLRYKKLLQEFTSCNIPSMKPKKNLAEEAKKSGAIIQKIFDSVFTKEQTEEIQQLRRRCEQDSKLVDHDKDEKPQQTPGSADQSDEFSITKEVIVKPPARRNALEMRLAQSPVYTGLQAKQRNEKYERRKQHHEQAVEVLLEEKRQLQKVRESNLKSLEEKISRRIAALDITYPKHVYDVQDDTTDFPELTNDMKKMIDNSCRGHPDAVVSDKFNIQVHRRDIHTLTGLKWLNDEVVNFYMNMLMERAKQKGYVNIYCFNTFFYPKLVNSGYSSVRRWTRKVDIFAHELLIVPVHLQFHWCLATIDFRDKTIRFYDSMLSNNMRCLNALKDYLYEEHSDKKKSQFLDDGWQLENVKNIPRQKNSSDCGVFMCKFSEYLSRNAKINFTQEHMPYFRMRMIYEIVSQQLL